MSPSNYSFHQSDTLTTVPCEYLRIKDAVQRFGLSRSSLYNLMSDGSIKSVCIRKKGNTRGARRINAESLRLFIESQAA